MFLQYEIVTNLGYIAADICKIIVGLAKIYNDKLIIKIIQEFYVIF